MLPFSIEQLSFFIVAVTGSTGMCLIKFLAQIEQSRCSTISCCCITCQRAVPETFEDVTAEGVVVEQPRPVRSETNAGEV